MILVPPRLRAFVFAAPFVVSAGLGALACTTDFTIGKGAPASDGGATDTGSGTADDAGAIDAGPSCGTLTTTLTVQLHAAITCPMAGALCVERITDECGCTVGVPDLTNAAVTRYVTLRDQAVDAGCNERCRACPSPPTFLCTEADGGGSPTCADPTAGSF